MLSDSSKSAFKMASEDPQKILLKSTKKTTKLSGFFSNLCGLNYQSYQILRPPFNSQFSLSFNFHLSHKTPGGLKT